MRAILLLLLLASVGIDALCNPPQRCCRVACNDEDVACVDGGRVHCVQMASLAELSEALRAHGYLLDDHFDFPSAEKLSIQYVDINTAQNSYFAQYSFLSSLKLFYCGIRRMRPNAFDGLSSLRTLHIVGLNTPAFDMAVLADIPHIRQLFITGSRMAITRMATIRSSDERLLLDDLEEIDLSANGIAIIQQGMLDQVPNLKVLNLADNELEYLPTEMFSRSAAIASIDLSGNKLKTLQPDTFAYIQPFATIRMRRNELACEAATLEAIMCAIQQPRHVYIDWNLAEFASTASVQLLAEACEAHSQHLSQIAEAMIIMRSGPQQSSATSLHLSTATMQTLISLCALLSAILTFSNFALI